MASLEFHQDEPYKAQSIYLYGYQNSHSIISYPVVPAYQTVGKLKRLYPDLNLSSRTEDNWLLQQNNQLGKLFRIKAEKFVDRTRFSLYKFAFSKQSLNEPLQLDTRHLGLEPVTFKDPINGDNVTQILVDERELKQEAIVTKLIREGNLQILIRTNKIVVDLNRRFAVDKNDSPQIYLSYVCGNLGERYIEKDFVDAFIEEYSG